MNSYQRCWTAYEKNQLLKFNYSLDNLDQYGDMPVEYITGHAEFCGNDFKITQKTLIPRLESEELVLYAGKYLQQLINCGQTVNLLDVGTGCGNIALAIFLQLNSPKQLNVTASDVDEACIKQAKENLHRLVQEESHKQFNFYQSNLLKDIPAKKYQLIVANLPYVPSSLLVKLDASVKYYEPNLALDGGEDGLQLVREFLAQAPVYLNRDGVLMMEIDSRSTVNRTSLALPAKWSYRVLQDQWGKQRFLILAKCEEKRLEEIVQMIDNDYNNSQMIKEKKDTN